jgi:hypothetical protein
VQDLDPGALQDRSDLLDDLVEPPGALRTTGDEQRGQVRVEAEGGTRLGADPGPVERGDGVAQRDADIAAAYREPILLARPGRALASCTTIGVPVRLAARYPGSAT